MMTAVSSPTSYDTPTSPLLPVVVNGQNVCVLLYIILFVYFFLLQCDNNTALSAQPVLPCPAWLRCYCHESHDEDRMMASMERHEG
jgi:hypothetical protein